MRYQQMEEMLATIWSMPMFYRSRKRTIGIIGLQGIGKDAVARSAWAKAGHDPRPYPIGDVIDLRPGQMEPADLIGRPMLALRSTALRDKRGVPIEIPLTEKTDLGQIARELGYDGVTAMWSSGEWRQVTTYAPPWWFPVPGERPLLIIVNEWNRAQSDTSQALFQFVYDRQLHNHVLEDQHVICTLNNPPSGRFIVNPFDPAAIGRVLWFIMEPDQESFAAWGKQEEVLPNGERRQRVDQDVLDYLNVKNGKALYNPIGSDYGIQAEPQPRTWAMFSEVYADLREAGLNPQNPTHRTILLELCQGAVGEAYAADLFNYLETRYKKPYTAEQILSRYPVVKNDNGKEITVLPGDAQMRQDVLEAKSIDFIVACVSDLLAYLRGGAERAPKGEQAERLVQFLLDLPSANLFSAVKAMIQTMPYMGEVITRQPRLLRVIATLNDKAHGR